MKRKVGASQDLINLLQKNNEEVMDTFEEHKTVVIRKIEKEANSVPILFIGIAICINRDIPIW